MRLKKLLVILSLSVMIISIFAPISAFAVVDDSTTLQNAKAVLAIGYASGDNAANTTRDLTLPTLVNGVTVSWVSNNSTVIDNTGVVNRLAFINGDAIVNFS